jgi:hypothetical protein
MSGSIFSGMPIPPQPTASDSSTSYPLWLQQYTYNLANAATNLASQPYQGYQGPEVATPSAATQQAWQLSGSNLDNYQGDLTQAQNLTNAAATPITAGQIQGYMNPYMNQVIGGLQSASNTNLLNNVMPGISSQFVSAGQSKSPQEMQAANNAVYQSQQALDQSTAGALSTGYQNATNTALAQQQAQQTGGAQMGQLGALTQQLGAANVGQLAAAGQSQDTTNQANINAAMNNFYAQQQWPYQNLTYASNIIRGQAVPSNTQQVGTTYQNSGYTASPLSSFLGTTAGASALGLKRGGHVRRAKRARGALSMVA